MTQKQQIDLLNSIMPEIVSTKDPEGVMLKCAKEHNLAPAQLEKLAQVFNTAKTLIGLEKQANRGDAFSIVDVPALVASYVTYDPAKQLSQESRHTHRQVNRLVKDAHDYDGWGACLTPALNKSASSDDIFSTSQGRLPNFSDWLMAQATTDGFDYRDVTNGDIVALDPGVCKYDIMFKSASAACAREAKLRGSVEGDLQAAYDIVSQVLHDSAVDLREKCAAVRQHFIPDEGRWKESVEDIVDVFGDQGAEAVRHIESYFNDTRFQFEPADLSKRAFVRPLAADRHDVFPLVQDIIELIGINKQAADVLPSLTPATKAENRPDSPPEVAADADRAARAERARILRIIEQQKMETQREYPEPHGAHDADGELAADAAPLPEDGEADVDEGNVAPASPHAGADSQEGEKKEDDIRLKLVEPTDGGHTSALAEVANQMGADVNALVDGMKNPLFRVKSDIDAPLRKLETLVNKVKPGIHIRQLTMDNALAHAAMETTKQQLMLSDPVIRDADPNTVNDIFETIAGISPTFAADPMKMAPVLKEALQYDSVPIHILRELAVQEGQFLKNEELRNTLNSNKYTL